MIRGVSVGRLQGQPMEDRMKRFYEIKVYDGMELLFDRE